MWGQYDYEWRDVRICFKMSIYSFNFVALTNTFNLLAVIIIGSRGSI